LRLEEMENEGNDDANQTPEQRAVAMEQRLTNCVGTWLKLRGISEREKRQNDNPSEGPRKQEELTQDLLQLGNGCIVWMLRKGRVAKPIHLSLPPPQNGKYAVTGRVVDSNPNDVLVLLVLGSKAKLSLDENWREASSGLENEEEPEMVEEVTSDEKASPALPGLWMTLADGNGATLDIMFTSRAQFVVWQRMLARLCRSVSCSRRTSFKPEEYGAALGGRPVQPLFIPKDSTAHDPLLLNFKRKSLRSLRSPRSEVDGGGGITRSVTQVDRKSIQADKKFTKTRQIIVDERALTPREMR